jgi:hypothetical protein
MALAEVGQRPVHMAHRVVENLDAAQHPVAGIDAEFDFFG